MKKFSIVLVLILTAILLLSCSSSKSGNSAAPSYDNSSNEGAGSSGITDTTLVVNNNLKLIYNVSANVYADDVNASLTKIKELTYSFAEQGDYIQYLNVSSYDDEITASITIMVKTSHLNEYTDKLTEYGTVQNYSQSSTRVNEKIDTTTIGLETQLKNLKEELEYYNGLLETDEVKSSPDDLARCIDAVTDLNNRIETLETQINKPDYNKDFSTLRLTLQTTEKSRVDAKTVVIIILVILLVLVVAFFALKGKILNKRTKKSQA